MFCHKCGSKLTDDASFCHNCGTKVVAEKIEAKPMITPEAEIATRTDSVSNFSTVVAQTAEQATDLSNTDKAFRQFIDNRVRETTKYQSAEDLLQNKKPLTFLWFCFGIPAVIGFVAGGPLGALGLGLFFGHVARWFVGGLIRGNYIANTIGIFDGDIDTEYLLQFLNEQLSYLHPWFHEWAYTGAGLLATTFGEKQRSMAIIHIIPDETDPNSKRMKYVFDAENKQSEPMGILDFLVTSVSFIRFNAPKHICLFKAVPILQAAMEYYVKTYKNMKGADESVLL